ncbi:MAG: fumarate reductase subunit D [Nocardioidaceae bacterium]
MTKRRVEPLLWLLFSGGGVMAAVFLPVLLFLFGLAFPLGWITPPGHGHLLAVAGHPLTLLFLLVVLPMSLIHSGHRFRFTVQHGLQLGRAKRLVAALCYGGAALGAVASVYVLWTVASV